MEGSPVNSQNPGKAAVVTDDERLLAAKAELLQFRQKQTEYFLKTASKILQLREGLSRIEREVLRLKLQSEVGFSADEVNSYFDCDESLLEHQDMILARRISPDVLRTLARCDEGTRSECLVIARRGEHLDSATVVEISKARMNAAMSAERTARRLRTSLFAKASRRLAAETKMRLEKKAAALVAMLPADDGIDHRFPEETNLPGTEKSRRAVMKLASDVRKDVGAMFPELEENPTILLKTGVAGTNVVEAWNMLRKLERGVVHFKADLGKRNTREFVEFVAGIRSSALPVWKEATIAPTVASKPTFVDIDAGVGATSLGLQAAGFEPVAVFAGEVGGREAILSNKLSWHPKDVSELEGMMGSLGEKDVDLLTSGLPWHHHKAFKKDWFEKAKKAVKKIRPKYFLFETLEKDIGDEAFKTPFIDDGYDVAWHRLDVRSFGIAQSKRRVVMVGARDGLLANFSVPIVHPPRPSSLAHAMGDLLDKYIAGATSDPDARESLTEDISDWREAWKDRTAPDLPISGVPRKIKAWKDLGIDITGYDNNPPSLEMLKTGFRLTNAMLKRIQGIPDLWQAESSSNSNSTLLQSSFPPVAAKMLGLAIHSTLRGVAFDYRRAAATRLLHTKKGLIHVGNLGKVREHKPPSVSEFVAGPHLVFKDRELEHARDRWRTRLLHAKEKADLVLGEALPSDE